MRTVLSSLLTLLAFVGHGAVAAEAGTSCADRQSISISRQAPWRCDVTLQAREPYLVRVDRQVVDVSLEWLGPDGKSLVKVDAPTRRVSPEILFYAPPAAGRYTLIVSSLEQSAPAAILSVQLTNLARTAAAALTRGLTALTAASFADKPDRQRTERAQNDLRTAAASFREARMPALEGEALLRIAGIQFWMTFDFPKAAVSAQQAHDVFAAIPDQVMAMQAAMFRAASLTETAGGGTSGAKEQFAEAERLFLEAADTFAKKDLKYDQALAINYLGVAFQYQARLPEAKARYQSAAQILEAAGEQAAMTLPLRNLAAVDYDRGNYADAIASYEKLSNVVRPEDDVGAYVALLNNMGTANYILGNTDKALQAFTSALPYAETGIDPANKAWTLHLLGSTYAAVGERERATLFLEQALAIRRSADVHDRRGLLTSLLRTGDLYRDDGQVQRALELHRAGLQEAATPVDQSRALLAIGLDQVASGSIEDAIATYDRALKLDLPANWPGRVSVSAAHGYALLRSGDARGSKLLEQAARAHQSMGEDELAAQDYYLLASEARRTGKLDVARRNIQKALALYETQRIRALNPDLRATYVSKRADAYELQSDLYLSEAEHARNPADLAKLRSAALLTAETLRVRALNDFRHFAEAGIGQTRSPGSTTLLRLDDQLAATRFRLATEMDRETPSTAKIRSLQQELAVLRTQLDVAQSRRDTATRSDSIEKPVASIAQIQSSLPPEAVLWTWSLGDERSWMWSITRENVAVIPLARREAVEQAARDLHALWSRPLGSTGNQALESKAALAVVGPLSGALQGKRSIIIVANGDLRAVPFAALWSEGADGQRSRLIETHEISYRPSLTPLPASEQRRPETPPRMLLVGDPVVIDGATPTARNVTRALPPGFENTLMRLPGARREIDNIARLAKGWQVDVLAGPEATKSRILAKPLADFQIVHFATHARLDVGDPQLSSIVLSSRQADLGTNRSSFSLREIASLRLDADTIVLSACEGSLGKQYRGQLSFGLSEAFLLAGANNVVGGLWQVSDAATQKYMQSFYELYVGRNLSPAAAAQAAARALLREPVYRDPFFWAAFVVLAAR